MSKEMDAAAEEPARKYADDKHCHRDPWIHTYTDFRDGFKAGWKAALRDSPEVMALVEALERECCCTGEMSYANPVQVLCDPCEALAAYKKSVGV